ncbi:type IV pilus biogenesis/stability protein PilW [Janthinobacterium fluminis]|uniref:Type IV pilus biogenesis/stability protein PilW n=1 Tax=Janthinobacterium fluminis TaxID=2987524 RepID=A0ABT5K779_9BURK|nr:type IV pilus biogenesis/stability protein PilW [Janthinobacterium fluminis]MDC8760759.1 type IV pilus biogenesis/stability protein PilW [Janthinobacterium fluminis]
MRRLAHRCSLALAGCCLAWLLGGCAAGAVGAGQSGKAELATASDQSAAQKRAAIRLQLAVGYYEQGQLEVALDEIKQALQAEPDLADAYGVRALIYMGMGQTGLAEDNFLRALKLAPQQADLSNNYGYFLCQNGRAAEAFAHFDAALRNPAYATPGQAYNNAGACSLKSRDNAGAERYLLLALKATPDAPATNANLARVYYERRDYARAGLFIARLTKLAKLESLTADVLWLGIKVQHHLGDAGAEASMVTQLRRHHSASPEYAAYQRGAFDE